MSMTTYNALVLDGQRRLRLETRLTRPLESEEVRVRMEAVGICGSDMHYFNTFGNVGHGLKNPLVLGHEAAGVVVQIGDGVTGLIPGDKVVVNPLMHCGVCAACRRGELSLCDRTRFPGSALTVPHIDGFFREYFETAERCCIKVPADTDMSTIALADPLACSLHALAQAGNIMGSRVLIIGTGSVGVMSVAAARLGGARFVAIAGRNPRALKIAETMGSDVIVDTSLEGALATAGSFDIVVESTGVPHLIADGMRALRRGGTLVQLGSPPGESASLPWSLIMEKELHIAGAMRWNNEFDVAVAFILGGRVDPTPILSRKFRLEDGEAAFIAAADHSQNMKVQFIA